MKTFEHLKPEHLEGLSWWFWARENCSYMNHAASGIYSDYWNYHPGWDIKEWGVLIVGIPIAYIIGLVLGPVHRKAEAKESTVSDSGVTMYNKNTIAYFTLLSMLYGTEE